MTDTRRPAACHYDRHLGERVTRDHRDTCPSHNGHASDCPGEKGCAPCTAPHCVVCGRDHTTNDHPLTCPECIGKIRDDLTDLQQHYTDLAIEATDAGHNGQLVAAAPIPGGTAQVLIGPTVRLDVLRTSKHFTDDHPVDKHGRPTDPLPALAILAQWEDIYRSWLGHTPTRSAVTITRGDNTISVPVRASIARSIAYLRDQVPYIANHSDGTEPDWLAFVHQVRQLRSDTERTLHDEREPERGVECFECGDRLVRRFRSARRCRHDTPARTELRAWLARRAAAQDWLRALATYPELEGPRQDELTAASAPPARLITAARLPCQPCSTASGGIDNPEPGRSWECPGCRKEYDPGEYATAVRRSLLDDDAGGLGWCTLPTAAEAAADITGKPITPATIRTWVAREDDIGLCCWWTAGQRFGVQLVYWPDVARRVTEKRARGRRAAS